MTLSDQILGTCERVVEFRNYKQIKLVGPCKGCSGTRAEAVYRNCELYRAYQPREIILERRKVK